MSIVQTLQGTLRLDGTLVLDRQPTVPPGRVEVVLRPLSPSSPRGEGWWDYLQRARREAEAVGGPFRTAEHIEEEHEDFRRGDDRLDEICRQIGQAPEGEPN